MHHVIALRNFICRYCNESAQSTAAKPVACMKNACQRKRRDGKRTLSKKPRASTAKAPDPEGSYKRHGAIWGELDALIAQDDL